MNFDKPSLDWPAGPCVFCGRSKSLAYKPFSTNQNIWVCETCKKTANRFPTFKRFGLDELFRFLNKGFSCVDDVSACDFAVPETEIVRLTANYTWVDWK